MVKSENGGIEETLIALKMSKANEMQKKRDKVSTCSS